MERISLCEFIGRGMFNRLCMSDSCSSPLEVIDVLQQIPLEYQEVSYLYFTDCLQEKFKEAKEKRFEKGREDYRERLYKQIGLGQWKK